MQEYESVKQQLEKDGYKISNAEFSYLVEYAKKKQRLQEKMKAIFQYYFQIW